MKQNFLVDTAENFQTYIWEDNQKIIPSSAFLTVYQPGRRQKLLDNVALNITPQGQLSYVLSNTDNSVADENYKAVLTYTHNGETFKTTLYYDVVNSKLHMVITDDDLISELPQLKDTGWSFNGTAQGGSTTSLVDSELKRFEETYFTGGTTRSLDKDEVRVITDFDNSTGTLTTTPFSSPITTDRYVLTRSYTSEIARAFDKIADLLIQQGKRPHLILDPYDLREVHIYLSVAEVLKGFVVEENSFWWRIWKEYEKKAEVAFRAINFKYDTSSDGYLASGEESYVSSANKIGRR